MGKQGEILEHKADIPFFRDHRFAIFEEHTVVHGDPTGIGVDESGDDSQECGLSTPAPSQ
jgi:hypothetical protein